MLGPGDRLDRYEILKPIAIGGTSRVWLGRFVGKHDFVKLVAIKTLLPEVAQNLEFRRMLLDEARIASRLEHPNLVRVYDITEVGDLPAIVMERLSGETFAGRRLSEAQAAQVADAPPCVPPVQTATGPSGKEKKKPHGHDHGKRGKG